MRNLFGSLSLLTAAMLSVVAGITGCSSVTVGPGQEAVLVMKPWIFGSGGVDPTPVRPGQTWVAPTTDYVVVPTTPIQYEEKFGDLMSSDGVPLDFDSFIRLRITDPVVLVSKFGEKWYENNLQAEFRNRVRQAVRKHGMNETAIDTTAIDAIDQEVSYGIDAPKGGREALKGANDSRGIAGYLKSAGLPVELVGVTVGKANPPDSVKSQRIATAAEQQRAKTEEQRKLAEDQRKLAEESRADADNAYRNKMSMSPAMFIQLEQIKMLHEVCGGGKDGGHCTFLIGQTGAAPVVSVNH